MSDIESNIKVEQPFSSHSQRLNSDYSLQTDYYDSRIAEGSDYKKITLFLINMESGDKLNLADCFNEIYPERNGEIQFGNTYLNQFGGNVKQGIISVPKEGIKEQKEMLALLHELGHIIAYDVDVKNNPQRARSSSGIQFREGVVAKKLQYSVEEDAWRKAVGAAEIINKRFGLNLFSLFGSKEEFREYIYSYLSRYKAQVIEAGSKVEYKTLMDSRFENFLEAAFEKNAK